MLNTTLRQKAHQLFDQTYVHVGLLLAFSLFLNRDGTRVPANNEFIYLLYVYRAWHPHFLPGDWTFLEPSAGHAVFNYVFGALTLFLPLEWVGWFGRVLCATLSLTALMRIGVRLKLPRWAVSLGIFCWLAHWQSFVTLDSIIPAFEAKNVGYACLLLAIDSMLAGKPTRGGILTGLAFTFHSAVGLWGGAAVGVAVLTTQPIRQTLRFAAYAVLFSLPGLLTSLPLVLGKHAITAAEAKFLVTVELPGCLDPMVFQKSRIAVLALMALFACLHAWLYRDDPQVQFLFRFELMAAAFFGFGVAARLAGRFDLVKLYPLRVYAVLAMLMFFWQFIAVVALAWRNRGDRPASSLTPATVAFGVFLFLCLPSPVLHVAEMAAVRVPEWRHGSDDDFRVVARWIAGNTPDSSVIVAPPWRVDAYYYCKRPLVASWHAPRYDALTEWRRRVESMVGDVSGTKPSDNFVGEMDDRAREYYRGLTTADLSDLSRTYGASYLITEAHYPYPVLFASGDFSVYKLTSHN